MRFLRRLVSFFSDQKLLNENPIFKLIVFTPASLISSVLVIPFILICLPFSIFNTSVQKNATKILLYVQHSLSLGGLYVVEEFLFKDFQCYDILIGSSLAFTGFYRSIKQLVNETLDKTFP